MHRRDRIGGSQVSSLEWKMGIRILLIFEPDQLAILATYDFMTLFIKEIRYRWICTAQVTKVGDLVGLFWV
jgi:hypothetical protein